MPALEEVAKQSLDERLSRMSRTADDLAAAIRGQSEAALVRRPDGKNWAATEVICHLRDTEEVFFVRFHVILSNDDPKIYADPSAADRVAEGRQYLPGWRNVSNQVGIVSENLPPYWGMIRRHPVVVEGEGAGVDGSGRSVAPREAEALAHFRI